MVRGETAPRRWKGEWNARVCLRTFLDVDMVRMENMVVGARDGFGVRALPPCRLLLDWVDHGSSADVINYTPKVVDMQ